MKPEYSIIIPAYHAANSVEKLFNELQSFFNSINSSFETVIVDDASSDNTWDVLKSLKAKNPNIKIIRFAKNFGQHSATLCGFSFVKGKFVITMDDDLEVHPSQISKLIEEQKKSDNDVVYGEYKKINQSILRSALSGFYKFGSKIEGKNKGKGSSFRLIKSELALKLSKEHRHFSFIDELLLWYTDKISFLKVEANKNFIERRRYSLTGLFRMTGNVVMFSSTVPLRFVTRIGSTLAIVNFLIGTFYLLKKFLFKTPVPGFTSIIVSVLFSTGLIVLSIGIVAQYISKILKDVNNKPSYYISEKFADD